MDNNDRTTVTGTLDPVTFSVIWGGLLAAAAEMGVTLTRTAYSVAVREGSDFSTGMFDANGDMVAQGDYSPGHLGSMAFAVRRMLQDHPKETLKPGDAIICNDPGIGSGHLPDVYMMCPVFLDDDLLGFAVNIGHQIDIGGAGSGSQAVVGILDNYQEGVRFMPTKIYDAGKPVTDIFRFIEANVRVPEVQGDIRAQYAANIVGEKRLQELGRMYGAHTVQLAMRELIDRTEVEMRAAIEALPDGTYTFEDSMDDVGPDTEPVYGRCALTIQGGQIHADWSGSGPQREAGLNCYMHYTASYTIAAIKSVTLPRAPQNEGVFRTVTIDAPEGSYFNAKRPAGCGGRAVNSHRIYEIVMGALAQIVPDRVIAANSHFFNPNIGGTDPRTGRAFICWESIIGGIGARVDKDGTEATSSPWNGTNVPVEIQESRNPVMVEEVSLIQDSAGPGEFRGGCGMRRDLRVLTDNCNFYNLGDRHRFAPYGLDGGQPGMLGETLLNADHGNTAVLHSKGTYRLNTGDMISWRTSGAGGRGNPFARDPNKVLDDVRNQLVSVDGARNDYGVVVDPENYTLDLEATTTLRAASEKLPSPRSDLDVPGQRVIVE